MYNCLHFWAAESGSNNAADHNLDLSLGNSSSKPVNNSQAFGNHHTTNAANHDQHVSSDPNWRNGGNKPKVRFIYTNIIKIFAIYWFQFPNILFFFCVYLLIIHSFSSWIYYRNHVIEATRKHMEGMCMGRVKHCGCWVRLTFILQLPLMKCKDMVPIGHMESLKCFTILHTFTRQIFLWVTDSS